MRITCRIVDIFSVFIYLLCSTIKTKYMHVLSEKYIFNINNTEQLIIRHLRTTRLFRDVVITLLGKCKYWRTAPRSNKGSLLKQKKIYPVYNVDPRLVRWQNKIASAECLASLWAAASGNYWHLLFVAAPAPDTGHPGHTGHCGHGPAG